MLDLHIMRESMNYERSKQQSIHMVFPVSTQTNFLKVSGQMHKPWLQQAPEQSHDFIYLGGK
jgi:hypothetical protein